MRSTLPVRILLKQHLLAVHETEGTTMNSINKLNNNSSKTKIVWKM